MSTPDNAPETTELDTSKLVSPNEDSTKEGTPLGDDAERYARETTPIGDDVARDAGFTPGSGEDLPPAPKTARSHAVDVNRALQRETHDGKGEEDPGPSDWQGYATDGVEAEEGR